MDTWKITSGWAVYHKMWMRPTELGSWGRYTRPVEMKCSKLLPPTGIIPKQWAEIPQLVARVKLLAGIHDFLAHCGQEKQLSTLCGSYWYPRMHEDIANCIGCCFV